MNKIVKLSLGICAAFLSSCATTPPPSGPAMFTGSCTVKKGVETGCFDIYNEQNPQAACSKESGTFAGGHCATVNSVGVCRIYSTDARNSGYIDLFFYPPFAAKNAQLDCKTAKKSRETASLFTPLNQ